MKLEVGKKYKDQFNTVFKIISDQASHPYKYVGESIPRGALIGFTYDGKAAHCGGGLVEEVREPRKFETEIYCFSGLTIGTVSTLITHGHWYGHPDRVGKYNRFRVTFEEIIE